MSEGRSDPRRWLADVVAIVRDRKDSGRSRPFTYHGMMWQPDRTKLIKIRLHDRGEDGETVWAEDLGPTEGSEESMRRVQLGNVPFLHSKPTYGDVIVVAPDPSDGMLAWDAGGVAFEDITHRIDEDSGRWAVIIDYGPRLPQEDLGVAFRALDVAGERADIAVEGAFAQADGKRGRAYLAVPGSMTLRNVLDWLGSEAVSLEFALVHPEEDT